MSKTYFTVTETCTNLGIEPHVLRYWEKEFDIHLKRNSAGRRIISSEQLARLQLIKHLLHKEKLTIKGAKKRLAQATPNASSEASALSESARLQIKKELLALKSLVQQLPAV